MYHQDKNVGTVCGYYENHASTRYHETVHTIKLCIQDEMGIPTNHVTVHVSCFDSPQMSYEIKDDDSKMQDASYVKIK